MKRIFLKTLIIIAIIAGVSSAQIKDEKVIKQMKYISGNSIMNYVKELSSDRFGGRLTGTKEYEECMKWSIDLFKKWGIKPGGDKGTYYQKFPNPYTLVFSAGELIITNPAGGGKPKRYRYEEEYYPGATSDNGTITAEVIFAGYGITAPELGYDDYKDIDVKGKIVLINPEIPVSAGEGVELFNKWRPYSFHDYKMKNAAAHGAAGILYNYHLVNPNCLYIKGIIKADIGGAVVNDIFEGTGKKINELVSAIRKDKKPQSFNTGKVFTISCSTEHHPEGIGANVIGIIPGNDPKLKGEYIIIGAHLDHLGLSHIKMPGANDNASACGVLFETAKTLASLKMKFKRSVIFILFGSEEQGVKGSEYYIAHLNIPKEKILGFFNLESVGIGEKIGAGSGKNYPKLFEILDANNKKYVNREMTADYNSNLARPRQDAAHFLWAGIPSISFGAYGGKALPYAVYHTTYDVPQNLYPKTMEDLAKIVFLTTVEMLNK